jgi:ABC-2 type transport system permease protein
MKRKADDMIVFLRELKRNKKSFLIWTGIFIVYNILIFSLYPAMADLGDNYLEIIQNLPDEFKAAFNADSLDFSNIISYFGTYSYLYFLFAGSIYSMILGAGILSKEESDKTVEFLLSKPIKRRTVVTGKLACSLIYLFLFSVVFAASTFILVEIYKKSDYNFKVLMLLSIAPVLVFFMLSSIGMFISVFIVKAKSIYPISISAAMGMFIIGVISKINEKADFLKYLSPFEYVASANIAANKTIDTVYLLIFAFTTAISIALTYVFYERKDITV